MPDSWTINLTGDTTRALVNQGAVLGNVLDAGAGPFSGRFRPIFEYFDLPYFALDQQEQSGVDVVAEFPCSKEVLPVAIFPIRLLLMLSVLEHHKDPFAAMRWAYDMLEPSGYLYVAVPSCWPVHDWPSDYWRFLPDGVRLLLANFELVSLVQEHENDHSGINQIFAVARKPVCLEDLT